MWRTQNLHVQAVRVVPPIVERRGSQHRNTTPRCDERSQRSSKPPDFHGDTLRGRIPAKTVGGDMGIINDALQKSVLRAEFRADDQNLQIVIQVWQVIHQNPPSNVYASPVSGTGIASASITSSHRVETGSYT